MDKEKQDVMISFGGAIKSYDDGRIGGYLVTFSDPDHPDLHGDYFTKDTDFDIQEGERASVYFNHAIPMKTRDGKKIVERSKIGEGTLSIDDHGVLIDAVLYNRERYEIFLGSMGWSSGTLDYLIETEQVGKAKHIIRWPLGKDASLTPMPAEPRNVVMPLKSLFTQDDDEPRGEAQDAGDASQSEGAAVQADNAPEPIKSANIPAQVAPEKEFEMEQEQIQELVATAAKEAAKQAAEEAVKAFVAQSEPTNGGVKTADVKVVTDEGDQPFENDGEFFKAVKMAAFGHVNPKLMSRKATGLSEGVPADGGYLLQAEMRDRLLERMYRIGNILSRVASDPVGPNSNSAIYNGVDETSRVDGSRYGGITGYWVAEGGTKTASKPRFRQVELKLKKVAALCYATDEQLEDTVNLQSWLARTVPEELRFRVEDAIVNGDGIGKPLGIMQSPALITVTRETGSQINDGDVVGMWARRWPGVDDYVWMVDQSAWLWLPQMTIGNWPVYIPPSGLSGQQYGTMFGAPVLETEYTAALNTTGDIILASLSQYQTITKGGIKADSSIHVQYLTDETAFRFVYRIDGQPMWSSALTPKNGGNTLSPYVVLTSAT